MATASIGRSSHKNTQERERVIDQMHQGKHIDDMTEKWLSIRSQKYTNQYRSVDL